MGGVLVPAGVIPMLTFLLLTLIMEQNKLQGIFACG